MSFDHPTYDDLYNEIYAHDQNWDEINALVHRITFGTFGGWDWVGFDEALTLEHAYDELEARMHVNELYLKKIAVLEWELGITEA